FLSSNILLMISRHFRVTLFPYTTLFRSRWVVVLMCAASLGSCVPIAKSLPGSFLPLDDKAKFQVTIRAPEGTSAEETLLYAERASALVRKLPHVTHVLITVGEDDQKSRN